MAALRETPERRIDPGVGGVAKPDVGSRSGVDYSYGLKVPLIKVGEDGRTTAEYPLQRGSLRLAWETGKTIPPLVTDKKTASGDVVTIEGNQTHIAEIDIQGTVVDAKVPTIGHADVRVGTLVAQEITTGNVSGAGPESMSHISVNKVNGNLTIGDYVDAHIGAVPDDDSINIVGEHTNVTVGGHYTMNGSSSAGAFEPSEERPIGLQQELLSEILHSSDGREFMRYTTGDGGTIDIFRPNLVKAWPEVIYENTQKGSRVKIASTLPLEAVVTTGFTDIYADVPYIKEVDVLGGDIEAQSVGTLILTGTATIHGNLGEAAVFGVSSLGAREVVGNVRVQGPLSEADKPLTYPEWEEQQRRNRLTEKWQRNDTDTATVVIQKMSPQAKVSLSGRTDAMVGDAQEGQIVVVGNEATLNGRRVTQGTPRVRSFRGEGGSTLVHEMAGIIQNSPEFIASHYPRLQPIEGVIIPEKEPYVIRRYECVDEAGQLHSIYLTEGLLERPAEVFGVNGTFMLTGKETLLGVSVDTIGTKVNATAIETVYRTHVAGEGSTILLNELKSQGFVGKGAMLSAENAAMATLSVRGEAQIEGDVYYLLSDLRSRVTILGEVTQSVALNGKYEEPVLAERSKVAQGLALSSRLLALAPDEYKAFFDELRVMLPGAQTKEIAMFIATASDHGAPEDAYLKRIVKELTWKTTDPIMQGLHGATGSFFEAEVRRRIALKNEAVKEMINGHREDNQLRQAQALYAQENIFARTENGSVLVGNGEQQIVGSIFEGNATQGGLLVAGETYSSRVTSGGRLRAGRVGDLGVFHPGSSAKVDHVQIVTVQGANGSKAQAELGEVQRFMILLGDTEVKAGLAEGAIIFFINEGNSYEGIEYPEGTYIKTKTGLKRVKDVKGTRDEKDGASAREDLNKLYQQRIQEARDNRIWVTGDHFRNVDDMFNDLVPLEEGSDVQISPTALTYVNNSQDRPGYGYQRPGPTPNQTVGTMDDGAAEDPWGDSADTSVVVAQSVPADQVQQYESGAGTSAVNGRRRLLSIVELDAQDKSRKDELNSALMSF